MVTNRVVLITGGTGSFGRAFVRRVLPIAKRVVVLSRDEWKQWEMAREFPDVQFVLGDVRDRERLAEAFSGVDVVVHAAALKQVPMSEAHPGEFIKTNVNGAMNVIEAARQAGVEKVVALSTDKAVNPVSLYGASKLCSDKLFLSANHSVVRYGNVLGSRGSIVPLFLRLAKECAPISITDVRMTRFWITLDQAVESVLFAIEHMDGGKIFVPKIPSMRIVDLAEALAPNSPRRVTGIRPGEKVHELLISPGEAMRDLGSHFLVGEGETGFAYASDTNDQWLSVEELRRII